MSKKNPKYTVMRMLVVEWNEVESGEDKGIVTQEHAYIRRSYRHQHTQHIGVCLLGPKFSADRLADALDMLGEWKRSTENVSWYYNALSAIGIDWHDLNTKVYSIRGYDTQLKTELRIAERREADIRAGLLIDYHGIWSVK